MSWLLGKHRPDQVPEVIRTTVDGNDQGEGSKGGENAERKTMDAYRFDSSALERAAEAARILERSSN